MSTIDDRIKAAAVALKLATLRPNRHHVQMICRQANLGYDEVQDALQRLAGTTIAPAPVPPEEPQAVSCPVCGGERLSVCLIDAATHWGHLPVPRGIPQKIWAVDCMTPLTREMPTCPHWAIGLTRGEALQRFAAAPKWLPDAGWGEAQMARAMVARHGNERQLTGG